MFARAAVNFFRPSGAPAVARQMLHTSTGTPSAQHKTTAVAAAVATGLVLCYASAQGNNDEIHLSRRTRRQVFSWGFGQFGQLGHGVERDEPSPRLIDFLENLDVSHVAAGKDSSAVVTDNGHVYTFGAGGNSRLGHGDSVDTPNQSVPQLVRSLKNIRTVKVKVGEYHMVALTADGKVWTWGKNRAFQLGHKNEKVGFPNEVDIPGTVTDIDCGRQQTVAVTSDGEVYTWGIGYEGSLGHGNKEDQRRPKLVEALKGINIKSVVCGREFTVALDDKGHLYSWGSNDYGQLGTGSSERYGRSAHELTSLSEHRIVQIACGEFHCAAVTDKGLVFTWGSGKDGQLGHGVRDDISLPRLVEALENTKVVSVACGGGHTAAIDVSGALWTFGRGRNGQLGRGDSLESIAAYRTTPTPVTTLKGPVRQVACGADHTLAIVASD